jgi:CRP-like cAMP-binding protein
MDNLQINTKLKDFFNQFRKKDLKKNENIEPGNNILFVQNGLIKMYVISINGEELTLNIFKPGTFFPMLNVFNEDNSHYQYEALEDSEILIAPKEELEKFLKTEPDIVWDLLHRVYRGMDGLLQRMVQFMSGDAYTKTIIQLLLLAKRFGVQEEKGLRITIPMTHLELSSHAGISRETVSRIMKGLENKGLIQNDRSSVIIEDIALLENILLKEKM